MNQRREHPTHHLLLALLALCLSAGMATAQPSWTKKAAKSIITVKTFAPDGTLQGSTTAFYVTQEGEAVGCYTPFKGASRAVAIDAQGKEWPVACILGANDTYDVAKFRVTVKKAQPLTLAAVAATQGGTVWTVPYLDAKQATAGTVHRAETFNEHYTYYTLHLDTPPQGDAVGGTPLFDAEGQVVGLMQQPYRDADTLSYAVDVRFADSLHTTGLSINDPVLRATLLPKALPADEQQALLSLYMGAQALDSAAYAQLVDNFITQFPQSADGYTYRAQLAADAGRYADADRDMAQAISVAQRPDEPHYSFSRMIYQKLLYRPEPAYDTWTLDKALEEARAAYAANPQPTYRHQEGAVLAAQHHYQEAYDAYSSLFTSALRSPDLFFEAAQCKELLGDTTAQLALLDSMVATFSQPYLKAAAPYILARAQGRMAAERYRDAVADLNDYEQLMATQVNDQFYYLRYQAEVGGRLFQQALNDIGHAVMLNPRQELYLSEQASLQVRVGLYDDAITTARELIELEPQLSDGHLFLGLAQCLKGDKAEGTRNLRKALELGDTQAEALIQQYGE